MTATLGIGSELHVSAALPAAETQVAYEALTFTEVGDVVEIGGGGGSAAEQKYTPLKTGVEITVNGAITYDTRTIQLGDDATDAGNAMLQDGFDGSNKGVFHSYKIVKPSGAIEYFNGPVGSYSKSALTASGFTLGSCDLRPSVKSVDVAAP